MAKPTLYLLTFKRLWMNLLISGCFQEQKWKGSFPSWVVYRVGLILCFGLTLISPPNRIWPLVSLIYKWKSLWKDLISVYVIALAHDFSVELEAEVKGSLTLLAWPLVSQKTLWEDASNSRAWGSRPSSVRLLLFLSSFFSPRDSLFLFSWSPPNICSKVKM